MNEARELCKFSAMQATLQKIPILKINKILCPACDVLTISGAPTPRMPLSVPRNMTIPLSFRLPLDDDCGVTTRNRPAPRKADEDDTEPILALPKCRAEEEGANASLGLGSVVNTAKPRPRPTSSHRLRAGIFLNLFFF